MHGPVTMRPRTRAAREKPAAVMNRSAFRRPFPRRFPRALAVLALAGLSALAGPAAAFELQTLDAVRTRIADHVGGGQWSLVQLWTTDCVPCERQKPMLEAFHEAHEGSDARVLGIALDGPKALPEILAVNARHGGVYDTLVAFDDVFLDQFEALTGRPFRATPTYLLYAPDGAFAGAHVGPIAPEALEAIVAADGG